MAYVRKTYDQYEVVTNYGYGWETEVTEDTYIEALMRKKEYIENVRNLIGIRIVKRRVRKDN